MAGEPVRVGIVYLKGLFARRGRPGIEMAARAMRVAIDADGRSDLHLLHGPARRVLMRAFGSDGHGTLHWSKGDRGSPMKTAP